MFIVFERKVKTPMPTTIPTPPQITFTKRRTFKISQPLAEQMLAAGIEAVDCEIAPPTQSQGAVYVFTPGNGNIGSWNVDYIRTLTRDYKPRVLGATISPRWNGEYGAWPRKTPETVFVEIVPERSGGPYPIQAIRFDVTAAVVKKNADPEVPVYFDVEIKPSGYITLGRDAARFMADRGENFAMAKVSPYGPKILMICPMRITPGTEKPSMYLCPLYYGQLNESVLIKTCDMKVEFKSRTIRTTGYWSEASGELPSTLLINTHGPLLEHPDPTLRKYKGHGHSAYRTDRSTKTDF